LLKNWKSFILIYSWNGTELYLSSFRGSKKEIINKKGPDPADIEVGWKFLIRLGAGIGFTESFYGMVLDNIVDWIEVKCRIMYTIQKNLILNLLKQKHPNSLPGLTRQYKILANILRYYSKFTPDNPAPPKSDCYFTQNVRRRTLSELIFSKGR